MRGALLFLSLLVLSAPFSNLPAQNQIVFDAFEAFSVENAYRICTDDFNGDGIPDVAIAGTNIHVLLCEGDGTFQAPVEYVYSEDYEDIYSIVAGDFDNDGDVDIAGACYNRHVVLIFSNDGTGVFTPHGEYATLPYYPVDLCLSDFDGDGQGDIAIRYREGNDGGREFVSVLLSDGDGTFKQPVNSWVDVYCGISSFCPSDFDDDGNMDLAVTAELTDELIILFGKGNGTFDAPTTSCSYSSGGEEPTCITASDYDLDGDADLAVLNEATCRFTIFFNQGDGTFIQGLSYYTHSPAYCPDYICSLDIDADADTDLIVTGTRGYLRVFLGDGEGNFQEDVYYVIGSTGQVPRLISGDFDQDGDDDLVTNSYNYFISILLNAGDGTFRNPDYFNVACRAIDSADLDDDGNIDFVSILSYENLSVFKGNGDGTVERTVDYTVGPTATSVCIADFDGDLIDDVAVINRSFDIVSIFLGNGDGTFRDKTDFAAGGDPLMCCVSDFNGDGTFDIAVSNAYTRMVAVLFGNGDGSFQPPMNFPTTSYIKHPYGICTSDFDGDGDSDIAVAADSLHYSSCSLGIMMNNGDGTFQPPVIYRSDWRTRKLAAADIDGDGFDDIIAKYNRGIRVSMNNGDGTFQSDSYYLYFDNGVGAFTCSDFNGDGDLDIMVAGEEYRCPITFLAGNGDGTFQIEQYFIAGESGYDLCAPDLDNDGDPDLVAALAWSLMVTLNLTPLGPATASEPVMPPSPFLSQNYPNPFNPATTFRFELPEAGNVCIAVYDVAGRRIAVVADRYFLAGGSEVVWNGKGEDGGELASGVYFARMTFNGHTSVRKLVLLR